jgi:uncharacterized protein YybS (DUF2232 family)
MIDFSKARPAKLAIAIVVMSAFIACLVILMTAKIDFSNATEKAFLILVGVLATSLTTIVNYYFGSSAGSAEKAQQLAAIAANSGKTSQ